LEEWRLSFSRIIFDYFFHRRRREIVLFIVHFLVDKPVEIVPATWQKCAALLLHNYPRFPPPEIKKSKTHWLRRRNVRYRASMLAQVLQIFLGKERLVKNWPISTLDKVIYYKGIIFQRSTYKTSPHFTK
jgi:hypothetical protein